MALFVAAGKTSASRTDAERRKSAAAGKDASKTVDVTSKMKQLEERLKVILRYFVVKQNVLLMCSDK